MFEYFLWVALGLIAVALLGTLLLMVRSRDEYVIVTISDLVFYSMIGFYIVWGMYNRTQIAYEIILLASVVGGILLTMSMTRIDRKSTRLNSVTAVSRMPSSA